MVEGQNRGEERGQRGGGEGQSARRREPRAPLLSLRSRATHLTRFLLRMRGALTDAATMVLPVMKMPHEAPTMHSVRARAVPRLAKKKGFTLLNTALQSPLVRLSAAAMAA